MTRRPNIWRSRTTRARIAQDRRQHDLAALRKMADAYDAQEAERAVAEDTEISASSRRREVQE
jgi:hypothetical protein